MYYVCFLDLLGQTDFFGAVKDNPHEKETIEQIARVSYAIESVVNYIEKSIERDLTGEASVSLFSDSIVIWLKGDAKLGCWLRLIVKVVHIALRYQIPIRGAISCGGGSVDDKGMFTGSPLLEAMDAEADFAVYPRIILVGKMRGWLEILLSKPNVKIIVLLLMSMVILF